VIFGPYRSCKPNEVHSHLQHAMTSFGELTQKYERLKQDYEQLQSENQKIKAWLANGKELLRVE